MTTAIEIIAVLAGLILTCAVNLLLVGVFFGGKFEHYDSYGPRITRVEGTTERLDKWYTLETGMIDGHKIE
jgi:hypothetical protein